MVSGTAIHDSVPRLSSPRGQRPGRLAAWWCRGVPGGAATGCSGCVGRRAWGRTGTGGAGPAITARLLDVWARSAGRVSSTGGVGPGVLVGGGIHAWLRPARPGPGRTPPVAPAHPASGPASAARTGRRPRAGRCSAGRVRRGGGRDRWRSARPGTPSGGLGQAVRCPRSPVPVQGRGNRADQHLRRRRYVGTAVSGRVEAADRMPGPRSRDRTTGRLRSPVLGPPADHDTAGGPPPTHRAEEPDIRRSGRFRGCCPCRRPDRQAITTRRGRRPPTDDRGVSAIVMAWKSTHTPPCGGGGLGDAAPLTGPAPLTKQHDARQAPLAREHSAADGRGW